MPNRDVMLTAIRIAEAGIKKARREPDARDTALKRAAIAVRCLGEMLWRESEHKGSQFALSEQSIQALAKLDGREFSVSAAKILGWLASLRGMATQDAED